MQRHSKEKNFKELLAASRRLDELYRLQSATPSKKLPKPIAHGYVRFFAVREDVLRSSIGEVLKAIIDATNTYWYARERKGTFRGWSYFGYTYLNHMGQTTEPAQQLKPLSTEEMEKHGFLHKPQYLKYFKKSTKEMHFGSACVTKDYYTPILPHHALVFVIKVHYHTHYRDVEGPVASEIAEIRNFMERTNAYPLLYGARERDFRRKKLLDKTSKQEIEREMLESNY